MRWVIEWLALLLICTGGLLIGRVIWPTNADLFVDLTTVWFAVTTICLAISGIAWAMRLIERLTSPELEDCTPPGGVEEKDLDVNSTLGAVSTPAVSCRTAGQDSTPKRCRYCNGSGSRPMGGPVVIPCNECGGRGYE